VVKTGILAMAWLQMFFSFSCFRWQQHPYMVNGGSCAHGSAWTARDESVLKCSGDSLVRRPIFLAPLRGAGYSREYR
jgi:hypothetical protein